MPSGIAGGEWDRKVPALPGVMIRSILEEMRIPVIIVAMHWNQRKNIPPS